MTRSIPRLVGYATVGAGILKLGFSLPDGWFAIAIFSHALLVALVFLLAAHLHSARAGAIAAASAIACPLLLDAYSPALSQVPTAMLSVAVWLLLMRGRGAGTALLAAVFSAAAWYMRGEALLMAPVWVWMAVSVRRTDAGAAMPVGATTPAAAAPPVTPEGVASRPSPDGPDWLRGAVFACAYVALCVPWLIALKAMIGTAAPLEGNPMLLYTPEYPGYTSMRTYVEALPGIREYITAHPASFAFRFVKDAAGFGVDLLAGLGSIAVGLALAGLLLRETPERWRALTPAVPLLIAGALQFAAFSCLERSPRFLVPIVPLACIVIGIAAAPSLDRICGRAMVAALFAVLILERGAAVTFQTRDALRRFPPLDLALAGEMADRAADWPRGALLVTDVPDWFAWHIDRPALFLPRWSQMEQVAADHPIAGVFLTPDALDRNVRDGEPEWVRAIERWEPIPGYGPPEILAGGARLYLREAASEDGGGGAGGGTGVP